MVHLHRTNSEHPDFVHLVQLLDADLAGRDGAEAHAYYAQFNKIDSIRHAIVAYQSEVAVGCGAIKAFDEQTMEVKRMYTPPQHRGKGIARQVLAELEAWATEEGYTRCVLETGKRQPEAIRLYEKCGYQVIELRAIYRGGEQCLF